MAKHKYLIPVLLLALAPLAIAQAQTLGPDTVLGIVKQAMAPAINKLTSQAISWLGVFAALQFFITNYNLLKTDGDIQSVVAKLTGAIAWVGICIYIINNGPQFISAVGDQMFSLVGLEMPSPGSIVGHTIGVVSAMAALAIAVGGIPLVGNTAGILLVYILLFILAVGMFFAFKIFMLQLELGLIAMLSPLSFSFLGLNTLKDQGIAPFKALLSLGYRIILLTVILSAFGGVSDIVKNTLSSLELATIVQSIGEAVNVILAALAAYFLLAYLTFKSDSIAATLASGSTSMGTADVAQAAAAGAAVGAAVATGGASAAGAAGKVPQAMSAFMEKMTSGGSVSNASPMGSGGEAPTFAPPSPAALSLNSGATGATTPTSTSSGGSAPPARPKSSTASSTSPSAKVTSGRYGGSQGDVPNGPAGDAVASASPSSAAPVAPMADSSAPPSGSSTNHDGGAVESARQDGAAGGGASQPGEASSAADPTPVTIQPAASGEASQAPVSSSPAAVEKEPAAAKATPPDPSQAPGSGQSAGIGGSKSALESDLSKLVDHLTSQQGPRKPTLGERLGDANRHLAQEQATVHVSISPHHHD